MAAQDSRDENRPQRAREEIENLRRQIERMRVRVHSGSARDIPEDFREEAQNLASALDSVETTLREYEEEEKGSWDDVKSAIEKTLEEVGSQITHGRK